MAILKKKKTKAKTKTKRIIRKGNIELSDFDDFINHRSDEYQLDRVPLIQTK